MRLSIMVFEKRNDSRNDLYQSRAEFVTKPPVYCALATNCPRGQPPFYASKGEVTSDSHDSTRFMIRMFSAFSGKDRTLRKR